MRSPRLPGAETPRSAAEVLGPRVDALHFWNGVAVDASGLDFTPAAPGESRTFGEQLGPGRSGRAIAKHATASLSKQLGRAVINAGDDPYAMVIDLRSLLALVQIGVIALHPCWSVRDAAQRLAQRDAWAELGASRRPLGKQTQQLLRVQAG